MAQRVFSFYYHQMKIIQVLSTICISLLLTPLQAQNQIATSNITNTTIVCDLKLFQSRQAQWYDLFYGVVQGLYHSNNYPVGSGCQKCQQIAQPLANLQVQVALIHAYQDTYLSDNNFKNLPLTQQIAALLEAYKIVQNVAADVDNLLLQSSFKILWLQALQTMEADFKNQFRNNFVNSYFHIAQMLIQMPGQECKQLGVQAGALLRHGLGLQLVQ